MSEMVSIDKFRAAVMQSFQAAMAARSEGRWELQEEKGSVTSRLTSDCVSVAVSLSGILTGELFLSVARQEIPSLRVASTATSTETIWQEVVHAAGEELCIALARDVGELSMQGCQVRVPANDVHKLGGVTLRSFDEHTSIEMEACIGTTLMDSLQTEKGGGPVSGSQVRRQPVPMDRVVDVPLSVTMRFGQRQLTLRELLDLSAGSLLELDRQVEEPVDLMLGERIIARGEVVIVDGNYGMRVTEVVETSSRSAKRDRAQPLGYASA